MSLFIESLPSKHVCFLTGVCFVPFCSCLAAPQLYSSSSLPCCLSQPPDHMIAFLPKRGLSPLRSENKANFGLWESGLCPGPEAWGPLPCFLSHWLSPWCHLPWAILLVLRWIQEQLCSPATQWPASFLDGPRKEVGLGRKWGQAVRKTRFRPWFCGSPSCRRVSWSFWISFLQLKRGWWWDLPHWENEVTWQR